MSATADIDCVVIGAGVVGLAIARALAAAGRDVMVIEQHDRVGAETSSRNSEVIHAGLYYAPGSLKARLCLEGKALLYSFAAENGVTARALGKLLVATSAAELPKLEAIAANAKSSGVDDLIALSAAEARAREPELSCVKAYLSPSTGIVDSHGLMLALEGHIQSASGEVVLGTRVTHIERDGGLFHLTLAPFNAGNAAEETTAGSGADDTASAESISCRTLVVAAGLYASRLARTLFPADAAISDVIGNAEPPSYQPPETHFAKGHYFTLSGRAPFTHLIYPMPSDGGLGVHLTLDIAGQAKFGPDVAWTDTISYAFDDPDGERRAAFAGAIGRWWPQLPQDALQPGYTGVRPKLSRQGEPAADFAIHGPRVHGVDRLMILYGIESPGLTSALAIARLCTSELLTL